MVIGIGNSGADIAVELSKLSKKVYLATRSGSWVMNRVWDGGEPADLAYLSRLMFDLKRTLPFWFQNAVLERKLDSRYLLYSKFHGKGSFSFDHGRFGLRPKHRLLAAHVTINDELPNRIISGTIVVKPNIGSFTENGIIFEDQTVIDNVDTVIISSLTINCLLNCQVIFATGFSFGFPILEDGNLLPVKENSVNLYQYMYPPALSQQVSLEDSSWGQNTQNFVLIMYNQFKNNENVNKLKKNA